MSGTVSDWCGEDAKSKEDCDFNGLPGTFEKGKGVDALYCYVKWRCPTPQLWRQLRINGKGFDEFVGKAGQIPYSGSNSYTEEVGGIVGKLSFVSSDSSPSNDSGKWTVEITDLGEKEGECGPSREPNRHMAVNEVRVVSIVPEVQYHKENGPANEWCPLDKSVVLHQGDELQCDPDGSVVLAFADNSTVVVRNTTQLKIAAFFTEGGVVRTEILLRMGETAAQVNKSDAPKSDFRIKAPSTGGVRGTTFSVFRDPVARAEVWSVRKGVVDIAPIGGRAKVILRAGQEVEITPRAVSKVAPIGKAGARGGLNRVKARAAVLKVVGRFNDPCGVTTPRARAFSIKPLGAGWLVSVRVLGKLRGWSTWHISGGRVTPKNALAKRIARGCR